MARIPINDENDADLQDANDGSAPGQESSEPNREPGRRPAPEAREDSEGIRAERDSLYERLARVSAEFKNSQRRMQSEMDQRLQFANSSLIKALLPVIDNFERALAVDPEKTDPRTLLKGMQIVHDQWMAVLKQQQVEEIAPE